MSKMIDIESIKSENKYKKEIFFNFPLSSCLNYFH